MHLNNRLQIALLLYHRLIQVTSVSNCLFRGFVPSPVFTVVFNA
jgi:hypothetical protein